MLEKFGQLKERICSRAIAFLLYISEMCLSKEDKEFHKAKKKQYVKGIEYEKKFNIEGRKIYGAIKKAESLYIDSQESLSDSRQKNELLRDMLDSISDAVLCEDYEKVSRVLHIYNNKYKTRLI